MNHFITLFVDKFTKIGIFNLVTVGILSISLPSYSMCDSITKAVYKDMNGNGFELRFDIVPEAHTPVNEFATVTLWHPKRGIIGVFVMGSPNGYGTSYLGLQYGSGDARNQVDNQNEQTVQWPDINVYFFRSSFQSDFSNSPEEIPTYIFVSGLGSWDWYDNQMVGGRDIVLSDPMWKLDRCSDK